MIDAHKPTYEDNRHWEKYQRFFPEKYRSPFPNSPPKEEWWDWKSYSVHLDRIDVPSARLKVILFHGAGGYGRFLSPLAIAISQHGISCVAPDMIGYGLTFPKKNYSYVDWIRQADDLIHYEMARDGIPIVVFGLSLGGMLAYHVAAVNSYVKGVIATNLLDMREASVRLAVARWGWTAGFGNLLINQLKFVFDPIRVPIAKFAKMELMSNNSEFNSIFLSDSLGGNNWVPLKFLRTLSVSPFIEPEQFHKPLLLVHPENDQWSPFDLSQLFFKKLAGPKELVILNKCGHAPIESPGIDQLMSAILVFLEEVATNNLVIGKP